MSPRFLLGICLAEIILVSMIVNAKAAKSSEQDILAEFNSEKNGDIVLEQITIGKPIDNRNQVKKEELEEIHEVAFIGLDDIALTADEQELMQQICRETGVDYAFALAMMESESHFIWQVGDMHLKNHAIGYFQISQINEERMKKEYSLDIYYPYENIEAGIRMIAELESKYDTRTQVIMAYKAGESGAKKLIEQGIILSCVNEIIDRTHDFEAELKSIKGDY